MHLLQNSGIEVMSHLHLSRMGSTLNYLLQDKLLRCAFITVCYWYPPSCTCFACRDADVAAAEGAGDGHHARPCR